MRSDHGISVPQHSRGDGFFIDTAFSHNLAAFTREYHSLSDIVRGQLGELAVCCIRGLISETHSAAELKTAFVSGRRLKEYFHVLLPEASDSADSGGDSLCMRLRDIFQLFFADYCRLAVRAFERLAPAVAALTASDFISNDAASDEIDIMAAKEETVSYFENPRSDEAFAAFSTRFPALTAVPSASFAASCEDVYDSVCRYTILPVFSGGDGLLGSFYRLIDKYDLKINAVTDLTHNDSTTRFALLGRGLTVGDNSRHIEISAYLPDSLSLAEFLSGAAALGAAAECVNASPLTYDPSSFAYSICLEIENAELVPLLLFINASVPDRVLTGIY